MLTMSGTAALCAAALLCWPQRCAVERLRSIRPDAACAPRQMNVRWARWCAAPSFAVVGAFFAGVGGFFAAFALATVATWYARSRRRSRHELSRTTEFASGIRLLLGELRAGAHPAAAADGAAMDAASSVRAVFRDMAATATLGGDVATVLRRYGEELSELRQPLERVARAWSLADRHGIALSDLLDAVRGDLDYRVAFIRDVETNMAGPRATAAVLACLPILGMCLGEAVGADPLAVLAGHAFGQILLVAGVGLLCAGTVWTARLTKAVAR